MINKINLISLLFLCLFSTLLCSHDKVRTDQLFVLYDVGETNGLLPVLKRLDAEKKDFHVLVMATAEKIISPAMFSEKRITLIDLEISETIDNQTVRTTELSTASLQKLVAYFDPRVVCVGTASRIQQQTLKIFPNAVKIAFVDNFDYDPMQENFTTCKEILSIAQHVLCPSINTVSLFGDDSFFTKRLFHVVGKPSLEQWEKEIADTDKTKAYTASGLTPESPIVTFIGGYGPSYEIIDPLFQQCAIQLRSAGYQVIVQPHPKVAPSKLKTTELLTISDFVVGYNSSVIFDAVLLGINAAYLVPHEIPFSHFAISQGYISSVTNGDELLEWLQTEKRPINLRRLLHIPTNSTDLILHLLDVLK